MNSFFNVLFIIPIVMFCVVFVIIIFSWVTILKKHRKNEKAPRISVPASVVAKRTRYSHSHSRDSFGSSFTFYYATFEVESGDRMELSMTEEDYGLLAEGDRGILTFKGTEFLSFDRER